MLEGQEILTFQLNDLSRYRSQLMGVAAIMIILCHSVSSKVLMPSMLSGVLIYGNLGVDIFLFLSGLGCYYSLNKTSGEGYFSYCKRRLYRIIPAYLIIFIPINLIYLLLGVRSINDVLLSITALEYWIYHKGAWFISIIIPLYLVSPFLYKLFQTKWKWYWSIVFIFASIALCFIPAQGERSIDLLHNVQFVMSRIPGFIFGMSIANDCKDKKTLSVIWFFLLALLFIPLRYYVSNVFWGWLVIPLMLTICVTMIKWLERFHWIDMCLTFMGTISLESYLLNISINALLVVLISHYGFSDSIILYGNYLEYAIVIIVGTSLAFIINKVCKKMLNK